MYVQGVRSQDIASILDIARVIACAGWLVAAQVRARDFDYFSTDFVRSVFVAYAHDSI